MYLEFLGSPGGGFIMGGGGGCLHSDGTVTRCGFAQIMSDIGLSVA